MHDVKNYAIIVFNRQPTRSAGSNYSDCNHFISNRFKWNKTYVKTMWGKTFYLLYPLNLGNFAVLKLFGPSSVHCLARER